MNSAHNQISFTAQPPPFICIMVQLDELKQEIETLGETIKSLKASGSDENKEAIATAVASLLVAKRTYAEHNHGVGVDGQPYQEPLTKAQKKALAKQAESDANAAAVAAASNGKQVRGCRTKTQVGFDWLSVFAHPIPLVLSMQESDPNSKGALKKAAKKAEAAAKRAELKKNGGSVDIGAGTSTVPAVATAPAVVQSSTPVTAATAVTAASAVPFVAPRPGSNNNLPPLQVVINPNVPLLERPIIALSVAVLTNTIVDLGIVSDHRSRRTVMGLEGSSGVVAGDVAMARYLARRASCNTTTTTTALLPNDVPTLAAIDTWVDDALVLSQIASPFQRLTAVVLTLEHALADQTYLVGHALTLADLAMFAAAGFCTQAAELRECLGLVPVQAVAARRWLVMMASHPALQEATQLCLGVSNVQAVFDEENLLEPLVSGMNALEGAVAGRVVTRFPPEPSGYLHIGHAKAVLLNDYYAKRYKGRLIVRFDDTNPSKEKEEYQESIVQDLAKLGVKPNLVTYTSDYFETITGYAKYMIQNGLAYMDDTPQEQMKIERNDRIESKHRNQTPAEALEKFVQMCSGSEEGGKWCLRAKINMKSDNGTLRDPVLFRQNLTSHHRSGKTYKAYPTYDLACPIVDSIEGVTHALRTTEYDDRNDQYQWIQKALGLRRVRVHTFSKVNFKNTVLSKRKLTWFVDNGHVTGWDDARFPTIRGVVRRGINITALRNFMYSQGSSKRIVLMDWTVFWSENKKEIDKAAKRFMAVNTKGDNAQLLITNAPSETDHAFVETSYHPKDPSMGNRALRICNQVLLETVDVEGIVVGEDIVLMRWGVVKITKINGPLQLEGEYVPDGDFKSAKRKLSWLADVPSNTPVTLMEFDNLISKDKIEEDENFEDFINPNTLASTEVIGDAGLKSLQEHDIIQLERRGYYRVDRPYINDSKHLILYMIPDGKSKSMSGQAGKLAHR
jgi:glutamyl-tRNA synthetase